MALATRSSGHKLATPTADRWVRLRNVIVEQVRTNRQQVAAHDETARELAGELDPDSTIERELAEACAARLREAVADGEEALRRLDQGTYGTCEACGGQIPIERLEAVPQARCCVACVTRGRLRYPAMTPDGGGTGGR